MLRGWDNPVGTENSPEASTGDLLSPNEKQDELHQEQSSSGKEAGILREWVDANKEENTEEEEDEFDEIGLDPFTPSGDTSSLSGWSIAPGAVDRKSFNVPYDYDNENGSSFSERTSTSPRAGRSTKTSLTLSKDDRDQTPSPGATMFDDIDLEALADTLPSPSSNQDSNSRNYKGAWTKRFLHEIHVNPSFKFKLIVSGSVVLVAACLVAIAATLSSGEKTKNIQGGPVSSVGTPVVVYTETQEPTGLPAHLHISNSSVSHSNKPPTGSPSYVPTFQSTSTLVPTVNSTPALTTASPSSHPNTSIPTYEPSMSPVTFSPTIDCDDTDGQWMTYNDKLRDCVWLDNGQNGAESARKDMNCLDSELGEKCRYTCRIYNGCMEYLLSAITDFTEIYDISIGDSCADKDGLFLSHGGVIRNCTWINEDPFTAPLKKNLNCGTPDVERTELGAMCPATCAGYNDCQTTETGDIVKVERDPTEIVQQNLTVMVDDVRCVDEDGSWLNHMGNFRQCRWFFTDELEVAEKKRLNCGVTEIGRRCKEACDCGKLDKGLVDVSWSGSEAEESYEEGLRENANDEKEKCEDEEGDWMNHENNLRQCRWLDIDAEINADAKKLLNCGFMDVPPTEIGLKCKQTCGCGKNTPLDTRTTCEDKEGLWKTHEGDVPRMCDWMDRKFAVERREQNCGKTEIGVMCQCKCAEPFQDGTIIDSSLIDKEQQEQVNEQARCEDEEGNWMNHENKFRQCRWLDIDAEINADAKKLLNCGFMDVPPTEIGLKCKQTCGCGKNTPLDTRTTCEDKEGLWKTHEGDVPRMCDWMDRKFAVERREKNCGKTEIGVMCQCKCAEPFQDGTSVGVSSPKTGAHGFVDVLQEVVTETCYDEDGDWMNHENKFRQCRWLDIDAEINADAKKLLNCGFMDVPPTEIGLKCKQTCGCGKNTPLDTRTTCEDKEGLWKTSDGDRRTCEWMDRKFPMERREQNCGKTEIGVMCQCKCAEPFQDGTSVGVSSPKTGAHASFSDVLQEVVTETCYDEDGDWMNHENKFRQCRWLDIDAEINADAKKLLNCGFMDVPPTEIGLKCKQTCGCGKNTPLDTSTTCDDKKGEWKTSDGDRRTCEWMDRQFPMERREQNCGKTEIGVMCQCKCAEPFQDGTALIQDAQDMTGVGYFIPLSESPTPAPDDSLRKHHGRLDETGKILTIIAMADATVSKRKERENFGDSIRLFVDSSLDAEMQALILFDLSYVEQAISSIGRAMLHLYARRGSSFGGVEFRKMLNTDFRQGALTWNNILGDGKNEPTIAFLDQVADETWYEVDVTAAVKDAFLNAEDRLGIRIVSSESNFSFASKDTDRFQPALEIDSRTTQPTSTPTPQPTPFPTESPVITLDCMDSKGFFVAHTGESQPCSWFEVGNGEQKKELNCKQNSQAAFFCQSQCSAYNGCDAMTCDDKSGSYKSHTGWREQCDWLLTGAGTLKLEQNCGTVKNPITELGKRCQATCSNYNGCGVNTYKA